LVALSPPSLSFGPAPQGVPTTLTLTVSNIGATPFSVNSVSSNPFFEFPVSVEALPKVLGPGPSLPIAVTFLRSALGTASGTLTITTSDPFHPSVAVGLSGSGTPPAPFIVAQDSLDYGLGLVGAAQSKTIMIGNAGSISLTVSQATVDDAEFTYLGPAPPFTVAVGTSVPATVRYNRLHRGAAAGTLTFVTNDPSHPSKSVELVGEALPMVPRIAVSGALAYGLGFVGALQDKPVTISNTGFAPLHVTALSFSGSPEFSLVGPGAPVTIAPGTGVTRTVRYARTVAGDATGTFHIASDDSLTPEATIALAGSAAPAPAITFSAPPRPTLAVGASTTVQVVVRNPGPGTLFFTPDALGTDLVETSPLDGAVVPLPEVRFDPGGGSWDIQADGLGHRGRRAACAARLQPRAAAGGAGMPSERREPPARLPDADVCLRRAAGDAQGVRPDRRGVRPHRERAREPGSVARVAHARPARFDRVLPARSDRDLERQWFVHARRPVDGRAARWCARPARDRARLVRPGRAAPAVDLELREDVHGDRRQGAPRCNRAGARTGSRAALPAAGL
jgi:hypothetical protein